MGRRSSLLYRSGVGVRVTLYSRIGCHLCDEARSVVEEVLARHGHGRGEGYEEIDVDADPLLRARYGEQVPVVLVDGKQHSFWRVDSARFAQALQSS